ncbi:hypothetical protein Leryth_015856 [Lithospermum erythrorhizon]|nr:hypothetical protein Leryth_015856 [Lithospermum erythrorhizon]
MHSLLNSSDQCIHAYGFFPCAESIWGFVYQIITFQYLMVLGEKLLTRSSTKIFASLSTESPYTAVYSVVFRILMAVPSLAIMTVSGILSGNEEAQSQVTFGISVSAGSTIFNLTVLWGINGLLANTTIPKKPQQQQSSSFQETPFLLPRDYQNHSQTEKQKSLIFKSEFWTSGVKVEEGTSKAAKYMFLSSLPFALMQLTTIFSNKEGRLAVIILAILFSVVYLVFYFNYQIQTETQKDSLDYAKFELSNSFERALRDHFDLNRDGKIKKGKFDLLLKNFDMDHDGTISNAEYEIFRKRFDRDGDGKISDVESSAGLKKLMAEGTGEQVGTKSYYTIHIFQVLVGLSILILLARPLTMTTQQLSTAMGLPPLLISFVMIPAVMNSRRALEALFPPNVEKLDIASVTFRELYSGVAMNNTMGFLASVLIVFAKDLTWNYSAEVLIIFLVCAIIGFVSSFRAWSQSSHPKWTFLLAVILYPFSAMIFYFLQDL